MKSKETDEVVQGRYVALGFDDFRSSDFDMVIPMLKKYGFHATFNKDSYSIGSEEEDRVKTVLESGSELGDHTWFHLAYLYTAPGFNGQNPQKTDGNQIPFPSNDAMRLDRGDGKNVFGYSTYDSAAKALGEKYLEFTTAWEDLSDDECQKIRETFSVMMDPKGPIDVLDQLSNKYLGTAGSSKGSWSEENGCYTGGIYTGCKTSENHEIWERILEVTKYYYSEWYHYTDLETWSLPGSKFGLCCFEKDGVYFYDEECSYRANFLTKFPSSLKDGKMRSWTDVLREYGYTNSHDYLYPTRITDEPDRMMGVQFFKNASLSRRDALPYPTNRSISNAISYCYDEAYFAEADKSRAAQMYDGKGEFYQIVESIRHETANGIIHGELIDSEDTFSEKVFLEELFKYCSAEGIEIITKAEAYDICFNQKMEDGNLLYNTELKNTAKEYMPDASEVPDNPDGYKGKCSVEYTDRGTPYLVVKEDTSYLQFGIPYGELVYSIRARGKGNISFYLIQNNTHMDPNKQQLECIGTIKIDGKGDYTKYLFIPDNPEIEYEEIYEGLGNKVIALKIVYSAGIEAEGMELRKTDGR